MDVISPDSSPFKALASEGWNGSAQHQSSHQSAPHFAAQPSSNRQAAAPQNGNSPVSACEPGQAHQRGTSDAQQHDASGSKRHNARPRSSRQAAAAQQHAECAGSDSMQPDMFAVHGVSHHPAESMSGVLRLPLHLLLWAGIQMGHTVLTIMHICEAACAPCLPVCLLEPVHPSLCIPGHRRYA